MTGLLRRTPLFRRTALRSKRPKDPVDPQVWEEVFQRDLRVAGGCVAPFLDAQAGLCRDKWGTPVLPYARAAMTVDHIREHAGGERRSLRRWMVTVCHGHHVNGGWSTAHRPEIRKYLAEHEA